EAVFDRMVRSEYIFLSFIFLPPWFANRKRYGTGSGSDRALTNKALSVAPGRYRSRYRNRGQLLPVHTITNRFNSPLARCKFRPTLSRGASPASRRQPSTRHSGISRKKYATRCLYRERVALASDRNRRGRCRDRVRARLRKTLLPPSTALTQGRLFRRPHPSELGKAAVPNNRA